MLSCVNARAWAAYIDVLTTAERVGGREGDTERIFLRVARVRALLRECDPWLVKFSLKIEENDE